MPKAPELDALQRRQDERFGSGSPPITAAATAARFLARVGIALRYGPTKDLPLASLYRAFGAATEDRASLARCIVLTNRLLGEARGIEVHVIAGRVTVVHRSLVPALYALVRRGRALDDLSGLSAPARIALALLRQAKQVSAGDLRRRLGVRFDARHDAAYAALGELAQAMLVDRGPFEVPGRGIPYLSSEGYPYHLFHEVHADLARAGRRYSAATAARELIGGYLRGAVFARVARLGRLFREVLSAEEIARALDDLGAASEVVLSGSGAGAVAVAAGRRGPAQGATGSSASTSASVATRRSASASPKTRGGRSLSTLSYGPSRPERMPRSRRRSTR